MRNGSSAAVGRPRFFLFGLALSLLLSFRSAPAQQVNRISYLGTLGASRIGLTVFTNTGALTESHYFYAKYRTNIALSGELQPGGLRLKGEDGGSFELKFTGNGSESGKPLDFENSVGLEGSWAKDGKSLPVQLRMQSVSTTSAGERWYAMVTDGSDAAFEARVRGFYRAALAGDRIAAAKYVDFPVRVNQRGQSRMIADAATLSAQWEKIFTPAYLATLKNDIPHELSIANGQAMLGAGDVWFSTHGVTALNIP